MRATRLCAASLLAVLAITSAVVAAAADTGRPLADDVAIVVVVATYALVGVAVELGRPAHPVGWLMLAGSAAWGLGEALLAAAVTGLARDPDSSGYALLGVIGSAGRGLGWLLLVLALPLVFPTGRAPTRWSVRLVAGSIAAFTLASLVAPEPLEERLAGVDNPLGVSESWQFAADLLAVGSLAASFVALVVAVHALIRRWRTGGELVRQQIVGFGVAFALPLLVLPIASTSWVRPWMFALAALPVPVAVGVAMFQRRLYDVQQVARRTLTYLALSAVLACVYALIVGGVGVMLRDRGAPWLPWAAAGVVAVAFAPMRDSLQRGVTRVTYGRWSTPAEVLADTGRRLADAADGRALLAALTDELVHGLGLDHVEIQDADGRQLAASGADAAVTERLPLMAYGAEVGTLQWAGRPLRPADRELLVDLAHQIGAAVHTTAVVDSLHRAREQLVLGREQERRRLRRDLHDGLGPSLAGLGLQVDAVQNLLAAGADPGDRIEQLRAGLRETVTEVRRIVEGLRPPVIDDLGLFGAVAELGRELRDRSGLALELELPAGRPPLPAAVEVAAYRVTQEALTNVVRHASATSCRVAGSLDDGTLVISVADDGRGGAEPAAGLGMTSMRERAHEIGGQVEILSRGHGTTVTIRLPVRTESVR
ncbi:sensor histidine kinase [Nocardioides sp.]|uniref:sensor histidine kinase n=1 Tax=Nocardioides sp. TaxID=35761 RepID=UPI002ED0D794